MPTLHVAADKTLTIPSELIEKIGLSPGDEACIEISEDALLIRKVACGDAAEKQIPQLPPSEGTRAIRQKNLLTGIAYVKGVGPKLSALLEKRDIRTVEDAIYLLPLRYEDRRELVPIVALRPGQSSVFSGRVLSADATKTRNGRSVFEVLIGDDSGTIACKWFNAHAVWMKRTWQVGREGIFSGEVNQFGYQREVHHPDVEWCAQGSGVAELMTSDPTNFGRIVPVYPLTEGLHQKAMRRIMREVLAGFLDNVENILPSELLPESFPTLKDALAWVHSPPQDAVPGELNEGRTSAHRALAYDEFFFWELGLALKKQGVALEQGIAFSVTHRFTKELARLLPFELTGAQRRVLTEIKTDMMSRHPMHRLVQGDVGSGKTLVALMAALIAVENGYQVAIMAPTEILAEQHWHTIHRWCSQLGLETVLITAGMKGKAKKDALAMVSDGRASIVIGTHAVIQEKVEFSRLGLGIIDEQHRFGVLQRGILKKKGSNPDILVMTATPIPRTLAMTLFGDLSLSVIDELPPGRTPVDTRIFFESRRSQVYDMVRTETSRGHQAYIIYPLVEESEKSDLKAASQMAEHLAAEIFPSLRIGLLHGRMTPDEKESIMAAFKARELDILVSTTVIEVGIDVPNASLMVVEHAERFGLSQLHQLRGRVGRGAARSSCVLLTSGRLSEDGEKRLKVMESTTDGFKIAEADLEIRGPGDFLGTRQAGMPDFRVASILRDAGILEQARNAAFDLVERDPQLCRPGHDLIKRELSRRWGKRLELATIG
ncbi:MAG TPA: ATP-dependent DNA helicase RecG [Desulfuromonadales bacterium]|nr:ATP-dependent DNA helicase RecG [Desulfuromonadales bacterium]